MLEERRKFIKAFAAASATCMYTPLAAAQTAAETLPAISLLLFEDPRFVLVSATSTSFTLATGVVVAGPAQDNLKLFLASS